MSRFKSLAWGLAGSAWLATGITARASADEEPIHEISAFYTSFASNVGGLPEWGARYRGGHFEAIAMSLENYPAFEAAYDYTFPLARSFMPRLIAGAAYAFGTIALAPGVGFQFPLISVGDHKFLGLDFDTYFYVAPFSKFTVIPVIPLSIAYSF